MSNGPIARARSGRPHAPPASGGPTGAGACCPPCRWRRPGRWPRATDVTGTVAVDYHIGQAGVFVVSGSDNVIGGPTAADRNVISAVFQQPGIVTRASGTVVQGNYIGVDATGMRSVANLRGKDNPRFGERFNRNYFFQTAGPQPTVLDDGARDVLVGGPGSDWFFVNPDGGTADVVIGSAPGEVKSR